MATKYKFEYVWLDGYKPEPNLRSKTKVLTLDSYKGEWDILPNRSIDGSTTQQAEGSTALPNFQWPTDKKIALVFGNEVRGVSQGAMDLIDECLEVPQFGTKHSFNISVCAGIVIWELFRQWKY